MVKNYVVIGKKEKEIPAYLLEKFNCILIDCTMLHDIYKYNARRYTLGLIDESMQEELNEFNKWFWED